MITDQNEDVEVIIVHGVGYVEPGRNKEDVQKLTDKFWPAAEVTEYCWDERVERPVDGLELNFEFFLKLGNSIRRAAWLGHDPQRRSNPASKLLVHLANISASTLTFATLVGFMLTILCLVIWIEQSFGLQRTPIWKEPTGDGSIFVTDVARLIVGSIAIYEYLLSATRLACFLVGGTAAIALAGSTLARGIEGFIEELRRIFLICLWPFVWSLCVFAVFPLIALFWGFILIILPIFTTTAKVQLYEFGDGSLYWPAMLAALIFAVLIGAVKLGAFLFSYQIKVSGYSSEYSLVQTVWDGLRDCYSKRSIISS